MLIFIAKLLDFVYETKNRDRSIGNRVFSRQLFDLFGHVLANFQES